MWQLLFSGAADTLEEPAPDWDGLMEHMEAAELLALIEKAQERLGELGVSVKPFSADANPVELYIDRSYNIRMRQPDGPPLPLPALVKSLFILFLRHPEGILLKHRGNYRQELEQIYSVITPNTAKEDVCARIGRLVNPQENTFSEKASLLNARLDELLPKAIADDYKIQGYNGHPRRIPLNPLLVNWQ